MSHNIHNIPCAGSAETTNGTPAHRLSAVNAVPGTEQPNGRSDSGAPTVQSVDSIVGTGPTVQPTGSIVGTEANTDYFDIARDDNEFPPIPDNFEDDVEPPTVSEIVGDIINAHALIEFGNDVVERANRLIEEQDRVINLLDCLWVEQEIFAYDMPDDDLMV